MPFAFASLGAAFGSQVRYFSAQAPNIRQPAICSLAEWDGLRFPDPESHPSLTFFREAIRRMVAAHRGLVPVAVVLPPPTDLPALVMGLETWLEIVLFNPDGRRRVMEKAISFFVQLVNGLLAEGAAFVALTCALASPTVVPRSIVVNFSRPVLAESLAQLHGPVLLHHAGAPLLAHLDLLTDLPATVAFGLDRQDNLAEARRRVGPAPVLFSGPSGPGLDRVTSDEVERDCRMILEERRQDARFVLCTCGADIPFDTAPEKIHALRHAAEAVGGTTS